MNGKSENDFYSISRNKHVSHNNLNSLLNSVDEMMFGLYAEKAKTKFSKLTVAIQTVTTKIPITWH